MRPTLVVPRSLCLFESVPGAGVALHERAGFARVQSLRLSPFSSTGANAALRGKTLMLWFWDENDVDPVIAAAGLEPARVRKICETLLRPPARNDGEHRQACAGGVDTQQWRDGAIVASSWSGGPASAAPALLARPWSRELLGAGGAGVAGFASLFTVPRLLNATSAAAVVACAGYAAYWGGSLLGAQERLAALETQATATTTRLGDAAALRQSARGDREWVQNYRRVGAGVQVEALLAALRGPFESHGVSVKELEVRNAEVRVAVVSAGAEIDLPGLLSALARVPGFGDVQLRQNVDATQATFGLRADGFIGGIAMSALSETGAR